MNNRIALFTEQSCRAAAEATCTRGSSAGQQSQLTLSSPYLVSSAARSSLACCVSLVSATILTCRTGQGEGAIQACPAPSAPVVSASPHLN